MRLFDGRMEIASFRSALSHTTRFKTTPPQVQTFRDQQLLKHCSFFRVRLAANLVLEPTEILLMSISFHWSTGRSAHYAAQKKL